MKLALIDPKTGFATQNRRLLDLLSSTAAFSSYNGWTGAATGLLTVAALCPDSVESVFIDETHEPVDLEADYDLVAITAMTQQAVRAYEIADAYRKRGVPVVLGGIHATVLPDEARLHADAVVVGEAEAVWPKLLRDFAARRLQPVYVSPGPIDLRNSPVPRYDLLNTRYYDQVWVQTSRGCPHDCDFCISSKVFGGRYRTKSMEQVSNEIAAAIAHFGNVRLGFSDDNLFVGGERSRELLEKIGERRVRWIGQADVSIGSQERLLPLLAQAGCLALYIGFETLSPEALRGIDHTGWKAQRAGCYIECIERIQAEGVGVHGHFIVGLDTDTPKTFDEIADFIIDNNLYSAAITILTPAPGTRLRDRLAAENRLLPTDWSRYTGHDVVHVHPTMTKEEIEKGLLRIYERIFSEEVFLKKMTYFRDIQRQLARRQPGARRADSDCAMRL